MKATVGRNLCLFRSAHAPSIAPARRSAPSVDSSLHRDFREVAGLVVHRGCGGPRNRGSRWQGRGGRGGAAANVTVGGTGGPRRVSWRAAPAIPDHRDMPMGFDERDFLLVGGGRWTEAVLPFEKTSPAVAGTPAYVHDRDTVADPGRARHR